VTRLAPFVIATLLASPAVAEDGGHASEGHEAHEPAAPADAVGRGEAGADHGHGEAGEDHGHGGGAGHGAAGGEHGAATGGEHHADFTGDHDDDGTANWLDADSPDFVVGGIAQHALNLLILVGVIGYFGWRPVGDALKTRAHDIRRSITDAAKIRDDARRQHDALVARLGAFEQELAKMKAEAEVEARVEEERLVARARQETARIAETAERNIRDEVVRAKVALRKQAVDLAVKLAEQTLREEVNADDQRRLAKEFLDSLAGDEVRDG
jgi:F-type H+-transporting ATPase subunit b